MDKININKKEVLLRLKIKALMNTADKFVNSTFAKLKRFDISELKEKLKKMNIPYYETTLSQLDKKEVNEDGELYNPIVNFINRDTKQKILIISADSIKKRDLNNLFNLKIFSEINDESISPNTLIILNFSPKDLLEKTINNLKDDEKEKYKFIFNDILSL